MTAKTDVVVIGAGPVGLMTTYCLAKHGVRVRLVEKLAERSPYSKASGVQPHTSELFAQLAKPSAHSKDNCASTLLSQLLKRSSKLTTQYFFEGGELVSTLTYVNYVPCEFKTFLLISQREIEEILERQLKQEFGIEIDRGWELQEIENLDRDPNGEKPLVCHFDRVNFVGKGDLSSMGIDYGDTHWNDVEQTNPAIAQDTKLTIEASWLVAADGSHSSVRHMLKIPFDGVTYPSRRAEMADIFLRSKMPNGEPAYVPDPEGLHFHIHPDGFAHINPCPTDFGASNVNESSTTDNRFNYRIVLSDAKLSEDGRHVIGRSEADFLAAIQDRLAPLKLSFGPVIWKTQFLMNFRKVNEFRHRGRIFLAGDAAHVHSPAGGFGMNTGLQDAFNLGWKLALVIKLSGEKKINADLLLDSYSAEREPVARELLAASNRLSTRIAIPSLVRKLVVKATFAALSSSSILLRRAATALSQLRITYRSSAIVQPQPTSSTLWDWFNPLAWVGWLTTPTAPLQIQGQYFRNCRVVEQGDSTSSANELYRHFGYCQFNLVVFVAKANPAEIVAQLAKSFDHYADVLHAYVIVRASNTRVTPSGSLKMQVFNDADGKVHGEFGVNADPYCYLVRPDGYVSYQCALAEHVELERFLKKMFTF